MMHKLRGGIGSLTKGMARKFEERGGKLLLHESVTRILVEGNRAVGVEVGGWGARITAGKVLSNLDPTSTFLRLMDESQLPADYVAGIKAIDHRGAYIQIQVALSELPEFAGEFAFLNEGEPALELLDLQQSRAAATELGRVSTQAGCRAIPASASRFRPCWIPIWRRRAATRERSTRCTSRCEAPRAEHGRLKDEMAERVIEKVCRYAPNFRDTILHQATFAPYHYESMLSGARAATSVTACSIPSSSSSSARSPVHRAATGLPSRISTSAAPRAIRDPASCSCPVTTALTSCSAISASKPRRGAERAQPRSSEHPRSGRPRGSRGQPPGAPSARAASAGTRARVGRSSRAVPQQPARQLLRLEPAVMR